MAACSGRPGDEAALAASQAQIQVQFQFSLRVLWVPSVSSLLGQAWGRGSPCSHSDAGLGKAVAREGTDAGEACLWWRQPLQPARRRSTR